MSDTAHVFPVGDLIEHDTDTTEADCACGPTTRPTTRDDGSIGWVITHHSLDGRERREQEEDPMHEAPTPAPTPARDARTRALRTVVQGAASTVLVAVAAVVVDTVTPGSIIDWTTLGVAAATAAGTALAAWVQRRLEGVRA